jgi:hypothetical protein
MVFNFQTKIVFFQLFYDLIYLRIISNNQAIIDIDCNDHNSFDMKTRVGQPSDATKYKTYVRKFEEGNPQESIDMLRDLEEIWTQNSMTGGH